MEGTIGQHRRGHHGVPTRVRRGDIVRPGPRRGRRAVAGDEMTAVTVTVYPTKDAGLRPLPWRRMAWVSWRHHRVALGGAVVLLSALALGLWIAGLQLHHAYGAALACHPASSAACQNLIGNFSTTNVILKGGFVLQALPAL